PESHLPALDALDPKNALSMFRRVKERTKRLLRTLPTQYEYLSQMRDPTSRVASSTRLRPSVRAPSRRFPTADRVQARCTSSYAHLGGSGSARKRARSAP